MAGEDVISRIKEAELEAARIVSDAERRADVIRAEAKNEAADIVTAAREEGRRSYETSILVEREKAKQEKEQRLKEGRKRIYLEEEKAKSRLGGAAGELFGMLEEYLDAQAR